jgi:hypothetical protein
MRSIAVVFVGAAVGLVACGANVEDRARLVKQRAAFDLNCQDEKIQVVEIGNGRTFGATGCNRRATYVVDCTDWTRSSSCTAIMNSDEHPERESK